MTDQTMIDEKAFQILDEATVDKFRMHYADEIDENGINFWHATEIVRYFVTPKPVETQGVDEDPSLDTWRQIAFEKEREIMNQARIIEELRTPAPAMGKEVDVCSECGKSEGLVPLKLQSGKTIKVCYCLRHPMKPKQEPNAVAPDKEMVEKLLSNIETANQACDLAYYRTKNSEMADKYLAGIEALRDAKAALAALQESKP